MFTYAFEMALRAVSVPTMQRRLVSEAFFLLLFGKISRTQVKFSRYDEISIFGEYLKKTFFLARKRRQNIDEIASQIGLR